MTTALVKERVKHRFDRWDSNGNGTLERSDMEREASDIAEAFGKSPSSPECENLKSALTGLFEFLASKAGISPDGTMSEEQFKQIAEDLIFEQGEAAFNRALSPLVKGIIGLCDKNADGKINREEFALWLSALGLAKGEGANAFNQIDKDGNGELTVDEVLGAVRDYHFGRLDVELIAI